MFKHLKTILVAAVKARMARLVAWALAEQLRVLSHDLSSRVSQELKDHRKFVDGTIRSKIDLFYKQLNALQAIDVDASFHDTGKIIIVASVNHKHIVQIIDIPPRTTFTEYKRMSREITERYGVSVVRADMPHGSAWANYDHA